MIVICLFFKTFKYDAWYENEESSDEEELTDEKESTNLPPMPALEVDDVKEGKGL